MAVPKGFRNDINIHPQTFGPERRQGIVDDIANKGTYLPKGVLEEDMDEAFIKFVKEDIGIVSEGEKIPVYFFTLQRWSEFQQTWENSDKYKHMQIPFISIVRHPDIQEGENQAGLWNIPGRRTYTYIKVPTFDGSRHGMDLYKIPQPTAVNITYEVILYTNRIKDLNKLSRTVRKTFQSRQHYISVNGHPMPIHNESTGDESNIDDFETRRYYAVSYEMVLLGYILDEEDFEVVPTINRTQTSARAIEKEITSTATLTEVNGTNDSVNYTFVFKANSHTQFSFISKYNIVFSKMLDIDNINRIVISVNGISVFDGSVMTGDIAIKATDSITIKIYRNNTRESKFQFLGTIKNEQ